MTKNRDRKQLVRERMTKTGESYATARRQLEGAPGDERIPPKGWTLRGPTPQDYELSVERSAGPDGHEQPCARVRSRAGATPEETSLEQSFLADDYRGARVRLRGSLRTEGLAGGAGLFITCHEDTKLLLFFEASVREHDAWARREIVIDIDEQATLVFFGMRVTGAGAAWLADVTFERVGKDVPVSASRDLPASPVNLDFAMR